MSVSSIASGGAAPISQGSSEKSGWASLNQGDFIRLLTVQLQNQDPSDPVDNKEMLAQMAQFSSLSGINDVNSTLQSISEKIDLLASKTL